MKNLFARLINKKPTRKDVVTGMKRDKDAYIAMFNNLARYEGQQQKLSQGVMALEKFLLTCKGADQENPEELLWTARIGSFQFLRAYLNKASELSNHFRGVDPSAATEAMTAFTTGGLDMLIEEPEVAMGWLHYLTEESNALDDIDTSDLSFHSI